jgi:predicted regulator of amino acid metabolism with ACT domain
MSLDENAHAVGVDKAVVPEARSPISEEEALTKIHEAACSLDHALHAAIEVHPQLLTMDLMTGIAKGFREAIQKAAARRDALR